MTKNQGTRLNRLASEKSPYLLKHSTNPVDWYSWGREALTKARNDNMPIFLSIGYSTCHWCSVMERESFEDAKTAAFINKNFIPIKVDREERPEIDAYYMKAVQTMTGSGGWPLSVFLTPDLKPFYGGTYFPLEPRYGSPSFMQVLEFVSNLWKEKREEVMENSRQVLQAIAPAEVSAEQNLDGSALDNGCSMLLASFDSDHGGFGGAPKFPLPGTLGFLLRCYHRTGKELPLRAALKTLNEIMAGGIRDHVGGGFHRYSTDSTWLIPHFEKMLYDNALLARVYAEAYQVTCNEEYAEVVRETLSWIRKEMKAEGGGFYSAQDADTPEGEGIYYTWTPEEVIESAGDEDGSTFIRLYGVTRTGNFEGRTILHRKPGASIQHEEKKALARSKRSLYRTRLGRPRPSTDTKILTSWNGLAISAFAFSSLALDSAGLSKEATDAARFILENNMKEGRLLRRYAGGEATLEGTLEDYAFFVQGLLDLFETTSEPVWLKEAIDLTKAMIEDYEDKDKGGFYLSLYAEPARLKESYDGPTPSGNSVAALDLIRLYELTGNAWYRKVAERTLRFFGRELEEQPRAHTSMLAALDLLLHGVSEIVITAQTGKTAQDFRAETFRTFIPDKVVLVATADTYNELSGLSTLLEGRRPNGRARVFVCQNFSCKLPAESVEELSIRLARK